MLGGEGLVSEDWRKCLVCCLGGLCEGCLVSVLGALREDRREGEDLIWGMVDAGRRPLGRMGAKEGGGVLDCACA